MTSQNTDQIVLSYEDTLLRDSDLQLLDPGNWLNDNIISFWFSYLQATNPSTTSRLYQLVFPEFSQIVKSAQQSDEMYALVTQILKEEPYANKDVFFLPINDCDFTEHGGNHWSLLVFHKNNEKSPCRAEHYDSGSGSANLQSAKIIANLLNRALCCNTGDLGIDVVEKNCPKQTNGYDCGIHLLCNVEALIKIMFFDSKQDLNSLAGSIVTNCKRDQIKATIENLKLNMLSKQDSS